MCKEKFIKIFELKPEKKRICIATKIGRKRKQNFSTFDFIKVFE